MNIFSITVSGWETNGTSLFSHPSKTREEFKADVHMLMRREAEGVFNNPELDWLGSEDFIYRAAECLPELGYTEVKPYDVWFNDDLIIRSRERNEDFADAMGSELFDRIIEHNNKVAGEL